MALGKLRVLTLTSSSMFAASLVRDLSPNRDIEIVASVFTDNNAIAALTSTQVDVIICDARVTGFIPKHFLQRLKPITSAFVVLLARADDIAASAYRSPTCEVIRLPRVDTPVFHDAFVRELANYFTRALGRAGSALHTLRYKWRPGLPFVTRFPGIIAIGASAGGTEATEALLKMLPKNVPGIVITQHMPPVFTKVYAERLNKVCQMQVREAADGEEIVPGTAMVAPGGMQMRVQKAAGKQFPFVRCRGEERVSGHCPSVDALFDSVAQSMGNNAVGIILTGMGSDGAEGLLSMRKKGCHTFGQDESTSMVYGMPRVAFQKGAVAQQLPLEEIPQALCSYLMP